MRTTISNGKLVFPPGPSEGDIHIHNGTEYHFQKSRWVVVPEDVLPQIEDRFVEVTGDTMSGTLVCPKFIGNYDLEDLKPLP